MIKDKVLNYIMIIFHQNRWVVMMQLWRKGRNSLKSTRLVVLAPVVQTLDSAIHRINHYPADKYYRNQLRYPLDRDLSGG